MAHRLVGSEQRATILSISSLAARLGGILAGLGVGWVATLARLPAALAARALLLAVAAPLYTIAGREHPPTPNRNRSVREQQAPIASRSARGAVLWGCA